MAKKKTKKVKITAFNEAKKKDSNLDVVADLIVGVNVNAQKIANLEQRIDRIVTALGKSKSVRRL